MPKVRWNFDLKGMVNSFDRDSQFTPYTGERPPSYQVFAWRIKNFTYVSGTREKSPQFRAGLELVPRSGRDEDRYRGYYLTAYLNISQNPKAAFFWVPFFDAIGVTGDDIQQATNVTAEGNVLSIGQWKHTGKHLILGQLKDSTDQNGAYRQEIGWFGAYTDGDDYADAPSDDDDADDDYDVDDYDAEDAVADDYDDEPDEF